MVMNSLVQYAHFKERSGTIELNMDIVGLNKPSHKKQSEYKSSATQDRSTTQLLSSTVHSVVTEWPLQRCTELQWTTEENPK